MMCWAPKWLNVQLTFHLHHLLLLLRLHHQIHPAFLFYLLLTPWHQSVEYSLACLEISTKLTVHKVYKCYTAPVCVITFKDNHELSKYIFFYTTYQRDWMSGPQITIIWFQQLDWNKLQIYRPRAWHKIVFHLPSKGTLLYWVIAFCASRRLSNTTSAVPIDLPDLS